MADQATNPLYIWAIVSVVLLLIAGITYIYTNRNFKITGLVVLLVSFLIAMLKIIGIVSIQLKRHFIGTVDQQNIPQIVAKPGWYQILYAWHIWLLPVIAVTLIFCILIVIVWNLKKQVAKAELLPQSSASKSAYQSSTRAERLSTFMAMDAAKKESERINEKLAEALLINAAYEIKVSDMSMNIHDLEKELEELKQSSEDDITILKLELSAKQKENEYIAQQLSERSRDLLRAQEMFEKLLAMQKEEK